jgi:hypothetical protein
MNPLAQFVLGILLLGLGGVILFTGLIVLGWQRHGAAAADLRFLHLDWILQPELPYWSAHIFDLSATFGGLIGVVAGASVILRLLFRSGHPSQGS